MPTLAEVRQQYPQYSDMSDADLVSGLHQKFYSDMPVEQFAAKIGIAPAAPAPAPQQAPSKVDEHGNRINTAVDAHGFRGGANGVELQPSSADVGMGVRQVIDAGAQLLTRGLEKIPGISDWARGQRQNVEQVNQSALDAYKAKYVPDARPESGLMRGTGQALVTGPMMAMKAATGLPAVLGQGAGMGAASSILTPVYETKKQKTLSDLVTGGASGPDDFWQQKASQAAEGALAGGLTAGAFNVAARAVAPNISPAVRSLMDEGVTPTPGQMLGGMFKTAEEKATSLPILGDTIKRAQSKGLDEYNVALYNRILRPIGEKYKGPAGQEGIAAVGDKLSAAYDDALARSVPSTVTDTFRAKMNALFQMVPQAKQADFAKTVNGTLKVTEGNTLTPSVAKDAESELGRLYRQYKGSAVAEEREYANALQQAQSNLRQLVAEHNPQVAPQLRAIDKGWSDLVQLENAANSTKVARNAGVITPADQLRGIKKSDYSVRDRRFARGEMPNQDFAQAADSVLSSKYPDSGSIGRLLLNGSVLSGGAALSPSLLTGGALASLPYLPGGRQAVAGLLARRPEGAEETSALMKRLAPYLGVGAAGLLNQ